MYLLLALFDCLMILFMIISYILVSKFEGESTDNILQNKWVIIGFEMGEKWSLRMSIFINTLLSVARTIKTVRPFSEIKMTRALLSVVLYGCYWIIPITLDIFSLSKNLSDNENLTSINSKKYMSENRRFKRLLIEDRVGTETMILIKLDSPVSLSFFTYFIPYVLPVVVCLISAVVMIAFLRREAPSQQSVATQRHVSITVLLITVSFVLCLSVPAFYDLALKVNRAVTGSHFSRFNIENDRHIFSSTVPLINALCNPVIMIMGSAELRGRLKKVLRVSGRVVRTDNIELQPGHVGEP